MARKTKEEAERTRARILETALAEFRARGFARSTLNAIAERAGFTRGAVYWHFKDKVTLFEALAEEMEKHCDDALGLDFLDNPQTLEDLALPFMQYLRFLEEDEPYRTFYEVAYLNTEWADELSHVLDRYNEREAEIFNWTEQAFVRLQSQGQLKYGVKPKVAALTLTSLATGLVVIWISSQSAFSLTEEGAASIRHTIDSFGATE